MNATRFDRLVASFVTSGSRRGLLRLLVAQPLLTLLAVVLDDEGTTAKKKRRKKCAKAGQTTSKKRKKCCKRLVKDATGHCAPRSCNCPANEICLRSGVCQPCTVTCTGTPATCGAALQAALNGGGTLYVCPGRYVGNFTIPTAVSVIGAGEGADIVSNTILDVGGTGRGLVINAGVGLVELERLRLTDSNAAIGGGGIVHQGTTLRMMQCTVSDNNNMNGYGIFGGGIYVQGGSTLEMTECTVSGNASNGIGGGIASGGTLEMTRCTVRDNHVFSIHTAQGGGIYTGGSTTLTDCLVEDNSALAEGPTAAAEGGGIYVSSGARAVLAGSAQVRNNAADFGGGILVRSGLLEIAETCRVTQNTASNGQGAGGGIYDDSAAVTLQGANPSPIVVNNCPENCAGNVPKCAAAPVSCPP